MKFNTPAFLFAMMLPVLVASAQNVLPVVITSQPAGVTQVTENESVTLSVTATGSPPLQYQWRRNGIAVGGQVNATFTLLGAKLTDNASYDVVITNPAGSATSASVALTVNSSRLINISTRGLVTPANALTAGFVIKGTSRTVLIRVAGPSLAQFGVPGVLTNPQLSLITGAGVTISNNDDWGNGGAGLAGAFSAAGAFPFVSADSKDAAIVMGLVAGSYTAQVTASNAPATAGASKTGEVLLEVYEIP